MKIWTQMAQYGLNARYCMCHHQLMAFGSYKVTPSDIATALNERKSVYQGGAMFLHFARGLKQGVGAGFPPAITQTHQYMPQALRVLRLADGFDHMA